MTKQAAARMQAKALAEAKSRDPEPTWSAKSSYQPPPEGEPWYYRFLNFYAQATLLLGAVLGLCAIVGEVFFILNSERTSSAIWLSLGGTVFVVTTTVGQAALIFLALEMARNIRELKARR